MNPWGRRSGFTLVELVIVIVILGLLSVAVVSKYVDLLIDAQVAANRSWIGGLRSAIGIQLTGVAMQRTTTPDPRTSSPAWDQSTAEGLLSGGSRARPTSLTLVGTNMWRGAYRTSAGGCGGSQTTNWTLVYDGTHHAWQILGP